VSAQPTPQYGHTLSTGVSSARGRSAAPTGLSTSAPVGHTAAHSPQATQLLPPIGWSRSKAMRAA
jgi:hypothetical protein